MRVLFTAIILIHSILMFAQLPQFPIDSTTGRICYTNIIQIDSVPKEELMGRAAEWIALHYKSATDVIKLDDRTRGKIVAKGFFEQSIYFENEVPSFRVAVSHAVLLDFKDGKCRIRFTDFYQNNEGAAKTDLTIEENLKQMREVYGDKRRFSIYKTAWIDFYKNCDTRISQYIKSLSDFLKSDSRRNNDKW